MNKTERKAARDLRVEKRLIRLEFGIVILLLKSGGELLPMVSAMMG